MNYVNVPMIVLQVVTQKMSQMWMWYDLL
jgi:hypothetical protein